MNIDLQNDLIDVFNKIRNQRIGNKMGELECANEEALKWVEKALKRDKMREIIGQWNKQAEDLINS